MATVASLRELFLDLLLSSAYFHRVWAMNDIFISLFLSPSKTRRNYTCSKMDDYRYTQDEKQTQPRLVCHSPIWRCNCRSYDSKAKLQPTNCQSMSACRNILGALSFRTTSTWVNAPYATHRRDDTCQHRSITRQCSVKTRTPT